ncbi:hypothetical protein GCM10028813_01450 [Ramlibacter alkalitolerans]
MDFRAISGHSGGALQPFPRSSKSCKQWLFGRRQAPHPVRVLAPGKAPRLAPREALGEQENKRRASTRTPQFLAIRTGGSAWPKAPETCHQSLPGRAVATCEAGCFRAAKHGRHRRQVSPVVSIIPAASGRLSSVL